MKGVNFQKVGRKWRCQIGTLTISSTILLLFVLHLRELTRRQHTVSFNVQPLKDPRGAYVIYVFDDEAAKGAIALLYSLMEVQSIFPRIVMTLPGCLNPQTGSLIKHLGGQVRQIVNSIEHPSKVRKFRQHLRFNKLHSWNLTEFEKVIMLDADIVVMKNIDHLFLKASVSAVEDLGAPGKFNTGLIVLTPDRRVFEDMLHYLPSVLSYNDGDQGFLNSYLEMKNLSFNRLSFLYNVFPRLRKRESWSNYAGKIMVLHFTAQVKPWDFYTHHHPSSIVEFDPEVTYEWTSRQRKLESYFYDALDQTCRGMKRGDYELAPNGFDLFINTYNNELASAMLLRHYSRSTYIRNAFIVWHDVASRPSFFLKSEVSSVDRIITFKKDSLNNRFLVFRRMSSRFALIVDDDVLLTRIADVDFAFTVAYQNPTSAIGVFPRSHHRGTDGVLKYDFESALIDGEGHRNYSMILTKFMFIAYDFMYMYTCLLPHKALSFVEEAVNCEDILMNWMISGFSGQTPLAIVPAGSILDAGTDVGNNTRRISQRVGHMDDRSRCMSVFEEIMGPCPLKHARTVVSLHRNIPFKKVASLQSAVSDINPDFDSLVKSLTDKYERQQEYYRRSREKSIFYQHHVNVSDWNAS